MNRTRLARALVSTLVLPGAATAVAAVLAGSWAGRLPDPIATHWNGDSVNNTASPGSITLVMTIAGAVLTLALTALAIVLLRKGESLPRLGAGVATTIAAIPAATLTGVLLANLDAPDWQHAGSPLPVFLALAGAAVLGVIGGLAGGGAVTVAAGPSATDATVGLRPGQRAVWVGSASNAVLLVTPPLAAAVITTLLATTTSFSWTTAVLLTVLFALVGAMTHRVQARVDASGVTIRMGAFGLPRRHVPLARITEAEPAELSLIGDGGLGLRFNALTGTTAYKVRGGSALVLNLGNGRKIAVSVRDAATGAGLVNDLLRHRSPAQK
ncbi:hypothetical protein [Amycolatopsis sp. NBC_01480]|uniref:hypothetical protein n=1 Tax=Amycolatopsis sp. NBC_01480 TaxID=2903562 RepID=UPI002E2B1B5E|nr:hypothetical protein [Amycolatopsis sp. NBC_01480]